MSKPATSRGWVCAFCVAPFLAIIAVTLLAISPARSAKPAKTASSSPSAGTVNPAARARIQASYAALPLAFEPNQGQTDAQVKYISRTSGYTLFLTPNEAVFALRSRAKPNAGAKKDAAAAVRMQLVGGNSGAKVSASDQLPGRSNYFIGNNPSKWQTSVPQYARVAYQNVYPGVNLAYHGAQRQLEFDFVVAPGASPAPIGFHFTGNRGMKTDDAGNLVVSSAAGNVVLQKPVAYQEQNGSRQPVDARFALKANNRVAFELGNYDRSRELVIDPTVMYSTYLGGSGEDDAFSIAFDSSGHAYVTGQTESLNFPAVGGVPPNTSAGTSFDVFVTKLAADGSSLMYSTYIAGTGAGKNNDSGNGIGVDSAGDAFVVGGTTSTDFPATLGAFQTSLKPGATQNAFVLKLNPGGNQLLYCTYLGGGVSDTATGMAVDGSGDVYAVGSTSSLTDFPLSAPLQTKPAGGFLTKLNPAGSSLVFSTYLGGSGQDSAHAVALDPSANAYVTGLTVGSLVPTPGAVQPTYGGGPSDAFVAAVKADGSAYLYLTYLGGSDIDIGFGIAVDSSGNAYITGETASSNASTKGFPLQSPLQATFGGGAFDAFVTKLNSTGTSLSYSTYLGGNGTDEGVGIAVDGSDNAYVTGFTGSSNFPTQSPTQSAFGGGTTDAFVTEINAAGSQLSFSTYLGGSGDEDTADNFGGIAVTSTGANIYVTGNTTSNSNFPTSTGASQVVFGGGSTDAFVVNYSQAASQAFILAATPLSPSSVSPGASATSTVTVTSTNGFTGAVTLNCSVSPTVTLGPTCSGSTAAGTGTLTVSTTAATARLQRPSSERPSGMFYAMLLPIAGLSLAGIGISPIRSRRRKLFGFLMIGLVMAAMILMPACGGSSTTITGTTGTPAGSYTITVTGTATGATQAGTPPSLSLTVN